jgi:hypothetical protein
VGRLGYSQKINNIEIAAQVTTFFLELKERSDTFPECKCDDVEPSVRY